MNTALQVALEVITPIFVVAGLGFWFGRRFQPDPHTLSRIAIYLFSPALVFSGIANSTLNAGEIGQIVLLCVLLFIIISLFGYLFAKGQKNLSPAAQSAFILSVLMSNSGNFGLSFVEFAYGERGLSIAVLVFVMTSIMSNTIGIYFASFGTAPIKQGILNIVKVPMIYATALAFIVKFAGVQVPLPILRPIGLLGQAAVPIMLVLLGVQLARISIRGELRAYGGALALASVMRLLIVPVIILGLAALIGIDGLMRNVLLVQLSTPTAVYAVLLATEFGSDAQFVTAVVFVTTLASLVTLSILSALFVG